MNSALFQHCASFMNRTPSPMEALIIDFVGPKSHQDTLNPTKNLRRFVKLGADRYALAELIMEASAPPAMKRTFLNTVILAMNTDLGNAITSYHDMLEEAGELTHDLNS